MTEHNTALFPIPYRCRPEYSPYRDTTAPLEFQAKWDYVESHGLHTVTPRPGYVVTLEDSAGQHWSGDSLQGAIEAHRDATGPLMALMDYIHGGEDDTTAPPTHYCSYCRYYGDDTLGTLEAVTAHGMTHPVTGEALPLEDDPAPCDHDIEQAATEALHAVMEGN